MEKPVIIGMNNPHSVEPRLALAPFPERVAGHRLWSMLNDVRPTSRRTYMDLTDRRNLLDAKEWNASAARTASEGLWESLEGRTVLLLGNSVANCLWRYCPSPLLWRVDAGVRWCLVPHPSGLNRWYNDPLNRLMVGLRLEEVVYSVDS